MYPIRGNYSCLE